PPVAAPGPAAPRRGGPERGARSLALPLAQRVGLELAADRLLAFPALPHAVELGRRPQREELAAAEEADRPVDTAQLGEVIGQDEAAAGVERHFGKRPQLGRAQLAVELATQPHGVVLLAVEQGVEALGAGEA